MKETALRVGILGAGQLARMLCESARDLGLRTVILAEKKSDCAIPFADEVVLKEDPRALEKMDGVDLLTIENEFVDLKWLSGGIKKAILYPGFDCLARVQDKLQQKKSFAAKNIPALDFLEIGSAADFHKAEKRFGHSLVIKKATLGYDGRGTYIFKGEKKFDPDAFLKAQKESAGEFKGYAEPLADFRKELAVIVARSTLGEVACYPVIETNQDGGICRWATAPAEIDAQSAREAVKIARDVIETFDGVGVFGVEMFWLQDGRVVVNEIAPRVHNSGHLTMNACRVSQFEMHWRAILGQSLREQDLLWPGAAMVNILGKNPDEKMTNPAPPEVKIDEAETWIHWYGKTGQAFGRKLGHVNAVGKSVAAAMKKASEARALIQV